MIHISYYRLLFNLFFGECFYKPVDSLPPSLTQLHLHLLINTNNKLSISFLPSLKHLFTKGNNTQSLSYLFPSLCISLNDELFWNDFLDKYVL